MSRLLGPLLALALSLVLALAGGWPVMWLVAYALAIVLAGGFLWAQLTVSGLELRRSHRERRIQVGDTFVEHVILETRGGPTQWWPRLLLEVHDGSDLPHHRLDRVLSLGPFGRRVWELRSTCVQRGRFRLGPVSVTSGDPFGIFRASRRLGGSQTVVVYPRTVPINRFGRVPGELPGGSLQGQRVPISTPNVASVREYSPGDPFNRIHWPSTARLGRLMVREFELDPTADIWLVLDLCRDVQAGRGLESTEEYAVTVVASLAAHLLEQGRSVGIVSQAATLPADRGPRQAERVLEVLALVRATSHLPLEAFLPSETARFARSSTLVVVTPSTSEQWVAFCQTLGGRGIRSAAVLVEAATFGPAPTSLLLVSTLAAARIPAYLVKRGEPIDQALAVPRTRGGGRP